MSRAAARRPSLYKKYRGAGELGEIAIDRAGAGKKQSDSQFV
jgi:hypothetical protein